VARRRRCRDRIHDHARGHPERALTFAYEPSPLCTEPTTSSFDPDFGWRVLPSAEPDCEGFTTDVDDTVNQYDAVGNPLSGMDSGNRLLSSGGYTMRYDADGNLTSKSGNGKRRRSRGMDR
jgi:YD repeat-containing protein